MAGLEQFRHWPSSLALCRLFRSLRRLYSLRLGLLFLACSCSRRATWALHNESFLIPIHCAKFALIQDRCSCRRPMVPAWGCPPDAGRPHSLGLAFILWYIIVLELKCDHAGRNCPPAFRSSNSPMAGITSSLAVEKRGDLDRQAGRLAEWATQSAEVVIGSGLIAPEATPRSNSRTPGAAVPFRVRAEAALWPGAPASWCDGEVEDGPGRDRGDDIPGREAFRILMQATLEGNDEALSGRTVRVESVCGGFFRIRGSCVRCNRRRKCASGIDLWAVENFRPLPWFDPVDGATDGASSGSMVEGMSIREPPGCSACTGQDASLLCAARLPAADSAEASQA